MQNIQAISLTRQEQVLVHHFVPGLLFPEIHTEPRGERSLEEIARGVRPNSTAYAFQLKEIIVGTVNVDGHNVQLTSQPRTSPFIFVGGTVSTIEELQVQHPEEVRMIENLTSMGAVRAIRIRAEHWVPFRENDQVLHVD